MMLGLSLHNFTLLHTAISLLAITAGVVVFAGMVGGRNLPGWTAFFLVSTVLTSATGFMFPFVQLLPSHVFGVLSLMVLAIALVALYAKHLSGVWRWLYICGAAIALYLNVFV